MSISGGANNHGLSYVIAGLHANCSEVLDASIDAAYDQLNGASYGLAIDFDAWNRVLAGRAECSLYESASTEFVFALLNNAQGQYRNAFKGLRLVLELVLQGIYLSVNLVTLSEWLRSQADTSWQGLMDIDKGVYSSRFCNAFFPELVDETGQFKTLAQTLYREMSECIHGNVPNKIPLPKTISFDDATFSLWHAKASTLRLIINFAFATRYARELEINERKIIEPVTLGQLGHIEAIRNLFGR